MRHTHIMIRNHTQFFRFTVSQKREKNNNKKFFFLFFLVQSIRLANSGGHDTHNNSFSFFLSLSHIQISRSHFGALNRSLFFEFHFPPSYSHCIFLLVSFENGRLFALKNNEIIGLFIREIEDLRLGLPGFV